MQNGIKLNLNTISSEILKICTNRYEGEFLKTLEILLEELDTKADSLFTDEAINTEAIEMHLNTIEDFVDAIHLTEQEEK